MNITRETIKSTLRNIMAEESEYQTFFKKALEKAGKSIPSMSDAEKKAFFNKIDAAWDGKGEKNEELVGNQHKLDGTPYRGNYAGIGYSYDLENDVFIPPKPYDSWTLNETTWLWEPPVEFPNDGTRYVWNENITSWESLNG